MIDVEKLRERAEIDHRKDRPMGADPADVIELLDHLEVAEQENALMDQERSRYRLEATKLAAHVKMQAGLLERFLENSEECIELLLACGDAPNIVALTNELSSIVDGIQSTAYPETSLARHDALKQAEAIEEATAKLKWVEYTETSMAIEVAELDKHAAELRRQAEGE